MIKTTVLYGAALAVGALAMDWAQSKLSASAHAAPFWIGLIAVGFTGLGVWLGARLFRQSPPAPFTPNMAAKASLKITEREFEVLNLLASGRTNKDIAEALGVSPNTVKTHVARAYAKLEASRRTEAIRKARELGLLA